MARTYISKTIFNADNKKISVEKDEIGHYKITCKTKNGWKITKSNLRGKKAAWFILRCLQRLDKKTLSKPIVKGKITNLLLDGEMLKMNGVEWITMSMMHGIKPIILKAPRLFRQRLIYIEPNEEGSFNLRIVDPLTDHRTTPVNVNKEEVDAAIRTFSNSKSYDQINEIEGR